MILRTYQSLAVEMLRQGWREPQILVAPTGAGKTVIAGALLEKSGGLIIAHTRTIVAQTAQRLGAGILMGSERPNGQRIVSASIQTLVRRDLPKASVVIVDEAHRSLSRSYRDVIKEYRERGACIIGLTATPSRTNGRGLIDVGWKRIVEPVTYAQLFDSGVLVRPRIYAPSRPNMQGVRVANGDYLPREAAERVIVGDVADHYPVGSRALAFAVNTDHSQALRDAYLAANIPAEHLDANDSLATRGAVLARLEARPGVVTNCGLFGEGFDLPCIDAVIMARPTLSLALYRQQAGRVMRSHPGKASCVIMDHAGNTHVHGRPWDPIRWSLDGRPESVGPAIPVRWCPECFAAYSTPPCPACGYDEPPPMADPIEHEAGTLVCIDWEPEQLSTDDVRQLVAGCSANELIYAYSLRKCLINDWKEGRATYVWKSRTGQWNPPAKIRQAILEAWSRTTAKARS